MRKVSVLAAPAATHLVGFCMQAENSVASTLDMGVTVAKFQDAAPMLPAPPPLSLALALRREPATPPLVSELGPGRPAYDKLFVKPRAQLVEAGVKGHRDPELAKTFLGRAAGAKAVALRAVAAGAKARAHAADGAQAASLGGCCRCGASSFCLC